jgi:nucleotide-binding universal stress UspA family protein
MAKKNASEQMRAFIATLPERSISHSEIISGNPAEAIVERARSEGYDLLVMGTHGRTGVQHLLVGSVAEKVVRLAPCPVLTVRVAAAA